jgi:hypothetical protein
MATAAENMTTPTQSTARQHKYHAKAYVLKADLKHPVQTVIEPQALVDLPEDGKYTYEAALPYKLDGIISYKSAYAQVAGHQSKDGAFSTLATSVVEGLNILDVITADRVVGQISTDHPLEGRVPSVTFLGTRFVNLHIGGHKVEVHQDLDIIGPAPADGKSYFEDPDALARMSRQYKKILRMEHLPAWAEEQFRWDKAAAETQGKAVCSLVNEVTGAPGISFGHVIKLPHFGKIFLGELCVERYPAKSETEHETYHFHLRMIRTEMGSIAAGTTTVVALDSNGTGSGGGTKGGGGH